MTREVCLVACSGLKIASAQGELVAARDLYMASDLFAKSRAYAEARCGEDWAILSAKHGLLMPFQKIDSYSLALSNMAADLRRAWAQNTRLQLLRTFGSTVRYVVLAGAYYRAALDGLQTEVPLLGMGIGQQKSWLKRNVRS